MEKFNTCLSELLMVISKNYPSQATIINNHYKRDVSQNIMDIDKHLEVFLKNCEGKGDDISSKNDIIFSKDVILLENINFNEIWNDDKLTDNERENIWKYLHSLYLHAYEYHNEKDVKSILKELKRLSKSKEHELSEEERTFLNIIECLTLEKKVEKDKNNELEDEEENDEDGGFNLNDIKSTFDSMQNDLFQGQIGTLAKEIADELDINKLNLSDPMTLLKNVVSGNFDENNDTTGVSSLVKNISTKVQNKIASGQLDENKLYEEAKTVMNKFGKLAGKNKNNPMASVFNTMMKQAEKGEEMKQEDIMNMAKMMMPKNMSGLMARKDRLKKKLEEKKQKK
jgi:hypothetical protein